MKTQQLSRESGAATPNEQPPRDATLKEHIDWGGQRKAVYEEEVTVEEKVPVTDEDGNQVYKRNPNTGAPVTPRFEIKEKGTEKREFILIQTPNGHQIKQYNFRESPEEKARRRREERRDRVLDELGEMAASGKLDLEKLSTLASEEEPTNGSAPQPGANDEQDPELAELETVLPGGWEAKKTDNGWIQVFDAAGEKVASSRTLEDVVSAVREELEG